jgi:hypothetical protein
MIHTGLLNMDTIKRAFQLLNTMKRGKLFQEAEEIEQLLEEQDSRIRPLTTGLAQNEGGKYRTDESKSTTKKGDTLGMSPLAG